MNILNHISKIFNAALATIMLLPILLDAQSNLEFVENKGQWNPAISFRGEMNQGAIALKPDGGYRLMLYNPQDWAALTNAIHPFEATANALPKSGKEASSPKPTAIPNDIDARVGGHVFEVKFLNGNPNPEIIPDKQLEHYNNYIYGTDASKWAGNCRLFNAVAFKNIYPHIDVRYYTSKGHLKYDFIVNPGGDASNIVLFVDGADALEVKRGKFNIITSAGMVQQDIPACFQFSMTEGRKDVPCDFRLSGNIVHFKLQASVNPNATLIIDPQFIFSTFTGSKADNWGFAATYDALGNLYSGGIVFGSGFPTTNGAYQKEFQGGNNGTGEGKGFDIGIMKFNPLGRKVLYATYVGGSGNDYPHSMVVDNNNELIIAGKTTSSNYPSPLPHFGPGTPSDNNFDIILTKLNAAGSGLIGSLVIGGTANDGVNIANKYPTSSGGAISLRRNYGDDSRSEVIIDSVGNIYVASCTQSKDFGVTSNVFQPSPSATGLSGRYQDAVIIKTTPDLSNVLFSTFLGGSDDDAAFVLAIDPITSLLMVGGGTASGNFPGVNGTVKYPSFQSGICDGFVSLMTNDGQQLIRSTYMGSNGADIVYGVQFDKWGYPYVMGTTNSVWPVVNAAFSQTDGKQFIVKLRKDFSDFEYSTIFGTAGSNSPNISPTAFLVDRCENVYVSGWGGRGNSIAAYPSAGTKGLTTTRGALKSTTDGDDFYFFVLQRNATGQLYGSFFGENDNQNTYPDHVDGGTSRFDKNGIIYQSVCANCRGGDFPTTAGAAYPNNGANGCNLAAFKIAFNLAGVGAAIRTSVKGFSNKITGCVPLKVDFIDTIAMGQRYVWDPGDGSPKVFSDSATFHHTYTKVGTYIASLISIDPTSCNGADTAYVRIRVRNDEAKLAVTADKTGGCKSLTYLFDNASTPPATRPFSPNSFLIDFGDGSKQSIGGPQTISHTYPNEGTYLASMTLTDTNYCNAPETIPIILRIADKVKAIIKTPPIGCAPYDAVLENASLAGEKFYWDFGDKSPIDSSSDVYITHRYEDTGRFLIKLKAIDSSTCNIEADTSFLLTVHIKPMAAFVISPNPPKTNEPIKFINQSKLADNYKWIFADGDTLLTSSLNTPVSHQYNATKTYRANLIAYNRFGCIDTAEVDIKNSITPVVEVANAIVPNGKNNTLRVRGYGIDKMIWRIYNRWGQVVFETTNRDQAWDGRYKGQIQAPDVYTYTLNITFTDGQQFSKTGDITLLK